MKKVAHLAPKFLALIHYRRDKHPRYAAILIGSILIISISYWWWNRKNIDTDNAYVNANVVQIATQVSGQIAQLAVENNQFVTTNQLILEIDQAPFIVAFTRAKANVADTLAKLTNTQLTYQRIMKLYAARALSKQDADNATAAVQSAEAAVAVAKANLAAAELDLQHTKIYAPTAGWVTNMSLRMGDILTANQPLFALVSNYEYWIDANFKETELQYITPNQPAKIKIDMYPGHTFKGKVVSISKGSGTVFSLLPPQNATGNWVKVTQRVTVKIAVLNPDPKFPLRIGTTASVVIDTGKKIK